MHPSRHIRTPRFFSAVFAIAGCAALALAVGFAKPSAAGQTGYQNSGPTTGKIQQNAQFISSYQINVVVILSCSTAGSAYIVRVDVQQPQGAGYTTTGNGQTNGQCTGKQQKVAVSVYPFYLTWMLGDAVASANACTDVCGTDTKQIHIVS